MFPEIQKARKSTGTFSGFDLVQFEPLSLRRICAVSCVSLGQVHFLLLREAILEEIDRDLREQQPSSSMI